MARYLAVCAVAVIVMAGCAAAPDSEPEAAPGESPGEGPAPEEGLDATPDDLVEDWRVTGFTTPRGNYHPVDEAAFTVTFREELDAVGQAACNDWNGNIQFVDDEVVSIGAVGTTREPCGIEDPVLREFETRFTTDLTRRVEWSRSSDTLTLRFQDGGEWELTAE